MKAIGAVVLAGTAILAFALARVGAQSTSSAAPARDGVIVHISHGKDDPQRALMGLNMANMMSDDHDVVVYFDIKAIELVVKDTPNLTYASAAPAGAELRTLREKKVPLMVCPGCLKAAGKTAEDLTPDMRIADKNTFFTFTKGRIVTFDY
jgi:predicted peroxiredoxin